MTFRPLDAESDGMWCTLQHRAAGMDSALVDQKVAVPVCSRAGGVWRTGGQGGDK